MSNNTWSASSLAYRGRREGVKGKGLPGAGEKAGIKKSLAKLARATGQRQLQRDLADLEAIGDAIDVRDTASVRLVTITVKGGGKRTVEGLRVFTSPNRFHLDAEGFDYFSDFAANRAEELLAA